MALTRGVYRSEVLSSEGHPFLFAVTTDRRCIQRMTVYPWDSEREVCATLYRILNRVDPIRQAA